MSPVQPCPALADCSAGLAGQRLAQPYASRRGHLPGKASFAKGVLTVTVPKPAELEAKQKTITVGKG